MEPEKKTDDRGEALLRQVRRLPPEQIEKESFSILSRGLAGRTFLPEEEPVIRRVIHTTADFEYADTLCFSPQAVSKALSALAQGTPIVTDTRMAQAGINKKALESLGGRTYCFMSDADVALRAAREGVTRAAVSMEKAAELGCDAIFAVGNAPTALIRLYELIREGRLHPRLIIGVPVGFVNVEVSKELIGTLSDVPYIVARGRKGGSNVAAAICNALLYQLVRGGKR